MAAAQDGLDHPWRRRSRNSALPAAMVFTALSAFLLVTRSHDQMAPLLSAFSTRFLGIFIEAVPFLVIGSLVSGFIEIFVDRIALARLVPRNPYLAGTIGVGLGFVVPVCECGVVPVVRRLYSKGLPLAVG